MKEKRERKMLKRNTTFNIDIVGDLSEPLKKCSICVQIDVKRGLKNLASI